MAIDTINNLRERAQEIANETIKKANSAQRVGALMRDLLDTLSAPPADELANFDAWVSNQQYQHNATNPQKVSYDGRLWETLRNSLGAVPTTSPLDWKEISSTHAQGTDKGTTLNRWTIGTSGALGDRYLTYNLGGVAFQNLPSVFAKQSDSRLYVFQGGEEFPLDNRAQITASVYESLTYAQAQARVAAAVGVGTLTPGRMYRITDRPTTANSRGNVGDIVLHALTSNTFAPVGVILSRLPKYDATQPTWRPSLTRNAGQLVAWKNNVYSIAVNQSSTAVATESNLVLQTNRLNDTHYKSQSDLVNYNFTANQVVGRADAVGNETRGFFGTTYSEALDATNNFPWGNPRIRNNKLYSVRLGSDLELLNTQTTFESNTLSYCQYREDADYASYTMVPANNVVASNVVLGGQTTVPLVWRLSYSTRNPTDLTATVRLSAQTVNLAQSAVTIDITGVTDLADLALNKGLLSPITNFTSSNASEAIRTLPPAIAGVRRVRIQPSGIKVTFLGLDSGQTPTFRVRGGLSATIDGAKGEWIEFEDGVEVARYTESVALGGGRVVEKARQSDTDGGYVQLDGFGNANVFQEGEHVREIVVTGSGSLEVNQLRGFGLNRPIRITPARGVVLTITPTSYAAAAKSWQILAPSADPIVLNGDRRETAEFIADVITKSNVEYTIVKHLSTSLYL